MIRFLFSSLLLILSLASPGLASENLAKVLQSLPQKLIKVEIVSDKPVIRKSKCCAQESYRTFVRKGKDWFLEGNIGLETELAKIESVKQNGREFILHARQVSCDNCSTISFSLVRDSKISYLWSVNGDPFAGSKFKATFIDNAHRAKASTKVDDDCPKDGEAC